MLFRRHVTEHGRSIPADHRRPDGTGDVVIPGCDVRYQRPQRIEGRFKADLFLFLHLQLDLVHRDVSRPLDHDLHVVPPRDLRQLSQSFEFRKLCSVTGIGNRSGAEPVAE